MAKARKLFTGIALACAVNLSGCGSQEKKSDLQIAPPRKDTPRAMRVMFCYAHMNYGVPFETLEIKSGAQVQRPAIIWAAGCAYAIQLAHTPKQAAVFSVDENSVVNAGNTYVEGCNRRDPAVMTAAYTANLQFMVDKVESMPWIDQSRIVVVASGEAIPVAAHLRLSGVQAKILIADPCWTPWPSNVDAATPTYVLRATQPGGMAFPQSWQEPESIDDKIRFASPGGLRDLRTEKCKGVSRPTLPANFYVSEADGYFTTLDRPEHLWVVQDDIFSKLWPS